MISSDEAFSLFEKWREERKFLYVFTSTPDGSSKKFQSIVVDVLRNSEKLMLRAQSASDDDLDVWIDLKSAEFEYADPRETFDPELAMTGWVCFVSAFLPSGGKLMFAERISQD